MLFPLTNQCQITEGTVSLCNTITSEVHIKVIIEPHGRRLTHTHTRLTAVFRGLPRSAGTRKVKPIWILLTLASAGPYASLHLAPDRQPNQHPTTLFFTDWMPFLPPKQQRQSTEGKRLNSTKCQITKKHKDTTIRLL